MNANPVSADEQGNNEVPETPGEVKIEISGIRGTGKRALRRWLAGILEEWGHLVVPPMQLGHRGVGEGDGTLEDLGFEDLGTRIYRLEVEDLSEPAPGDDPVPFRIVDDETGRDQLIFDELYKAVELGGAGSYRWSTVGYKDWRGVPSVVLWVFRRHWGSGRILWAGERIFEVTLSEIEGEPVLNVERLAL